MKFQLFGHSGQVGEIRQIDANRIASKSSDNQTIIWNLTSGDVIYKFNEFNYYRDEKEDNLQSMVKGLSVLENGLLASGSHSSINIWDTFTGRLKFSIKTPLSNVWCIIKLENSLLGSAYGLFKN